MPLNPNFNQTITIYHKAGDTWARRVVHNCAWRGADQFSTDSAGYEQSAGSYIIRIAASSKVGIAVGDLVVKGACTDIVTGKTPNTITEVLQAHKPDAFIVKDVIDNTGHLQGRHYKVVG